MPVSLSFNYSYGSSLSVFYGTQVVSGLVLALHYVISFESVIEYTRITDFSLFFRYMHANGASFFLGFVFLHVGWGLYYSSANKRVLWVTSVIMGVSFMSVAFLSYVLPYGQMSYWSATVMMNLLSVMSKEVVVFLWGGFVVGEYTLSRFYVFHFLVPLALSLLMMSHLHMLHLSSGSSLSYSAEKMSFFPYLMLKDSLVWCFYFIFYVLLLCVYSNSLGDAENYKLADPMVTPLHMKPEWYFLFAYAILRCIPNKTMGVVALSAAVLVPLVSILGSSVIGFSNIGFFFFTFLLLTVFGSMPMIMHYYFGSQVFSMMYFFFMLFFV